MRTKVCNLLASLALSVTFQAQAQNPPPEQDRASTANSTATERVMPLEVTINGTEAGQWALLERSGILFAPINALEEWRLQARPSSQEIQYRGQTWYPLNPIPGFTAQYNLAAQSVALSFSPTAFSATRIVHEGQTELELTPAVLAGFMNYDLNLDSVHARNVAATHELGGVFEFGVSGAMGVLTSSHVARAIGSNNPDTPESWRRLETVFKKDFPTNSISLRVGDSATRTSIFGSSLYFGGVQVARNFALRPGFITQPIPTISGTSSAAGTVDLYINNALRQTSNVPAGPFTIDNSSLVNGSGEARIVIRDLLGRETILVQPFFTHSDLLEVGLSDWSFEAGRLRNNLGTDNANYGTAFVSGLWRQGITKTFTIAGEFKRASQANTWAAGATLGLPFQTLGVLSVSKSRAALAPAGSGTRWAAGLERTSLQHSVTLRVEKANPNYREIDWSAATRASRSQRSASYSYSSARWGTLGFGFAQARAFDGSSNSSLSLSYSMRVGERSTLSLTSTRVFGSSSGTSIGISLIIPLENSVVLSANATRQGGEQAGYISASQALGAETGIGWRALVGSRAKVPYSEAGLYYQGSKGLINADISASRTQQAVRLGAQGGAVFMDGRFFTSRRVENSFALVEVPGYANIGVGFQGSNLTRTNADGMALLTRLTPYQSNSVRLDPAELPISAELDSIEQTAVPAAQTGVKITFPVRSGRAALLKIVLDDGQPAPAGAEVELVGDKKEFFVARRGETFITGMQMNNTLRLKWKENECVFPVALPPEELNSITRVGPLVCSGVAR